MLLKGNSQPKPYVVSVARGVYGWLLCYGFVYNAVTHHPYPDLCLSTLNRCTDSERLLRDDNLGINPLLVLIKDLIGRTDILRGYL